MTRGVFVLPGGAGFCNAVRRCVLDDVVSWAPYKVDVRTNTSCQTDEFLAHRIGLLPFCKVHDGPREMTLRVTGPQTACARHLQSPSFRAVHPDVEIMMLGPGQALDLTIHFDQQRASKHARYCLSAGVGMERVDGDGRHRLVLETLDDRAPVDVVNEALDALEARVDTALHALAHQPEEAPRSMC